MGSHITPAVSPMSGIQLSTPKKRKNRKTEHAKFITPPCLREGGVRIRIMPSNHYNKVSFNKNTIGEIFLNMFFNEKVSV